MKEHSIYMNRCLELAKLGAGNVAPNPMVGAVLVYHDRIIGEGYHRQYGGPHAEVNCIASVAEADRPLIASSTLYVSLEPCAHYGKTPPCADLIVQQRIPEVVIGCRDIFARVNGLGIRKLEEAGIQVITGVLEKECVELNKRFFCFHQRKRPFILLKWAQTADGFIAAENFKAIKISNEITNRLVHKMRTEEAAIMVGFNTALHDNPSLTARSWPGKSPVRIVTDKILSLPAGAAVFNNDAPVIVVNQLKEGQEGNIHYLQIVAGEEMLPVLMEKLYQRNIQSLLVEGGAQLLQSFFRGGLWDEAVRITNTGMQLGKGIPAPEITADAILTGERHMGTDTIQFFKNQGNSGLL
ncbi:MAG: bifunctional diaminohydroxyphosphoribosylaminopyrimidine deaminase/5-amino-6-(5-phosphoribosylamino)uracil reductase RibD [Ferruginibacter sp.]